MEYDYYVETEENLSEPMKLKLEKIKRLSEKGKDFMLKTLRKMHQLAQIKKNTQILIRVKNLMKYTG